jgi:hypothetical protein
VSSTYPVNDQIWFDAESSNAASFQNFQDNLDSFVNHLERKRHKYNEIGFVKFVYFKVHRKYLKRYQTPSTLSDLYTNQFYDCLTGTALYSMVLKRLDIAHDIIETTFHVYLTLDIAGEKVIIESTSPLNGFIVDPQVVQKTLNQYSEYVGGNVWADQQYHKPSQPVNNIISLTELAGLQYFNQAVEAYNQKDLKSACDQMSKALNYYPSDRLKEMMVIMLNTISSNSDIDPLLEYETLSKFGYLKEVPMATNKVK